MFKVQNLGAALGLAFNRHDIDNIVKVMAEVGHDISPSLLEHIYQLLARGESYLGQIKLPQDPRRGLLHG